MISRTVRRLVLGAAAVVLAGAGGLAVSAAAVASMAGDESSAPLQSRDFPVNASGETYGSAAGAAKDPDLIRASGDIGVEGYIRASDLNGPVFSSPEEAVAHQEAHNTLDERQIPLYASDGRTVLGMFTVSATVVKAD